MSTNCQKQTQSARSSGLASEGIDKPVLKQVNKLRHSLTDALIPIDTSKHPNLQLPAASPVYACRRLFEAIGGTAMMTELEFLNRFRRSPNGVWACTKPINVNGPNGLVVIDQGRRFGPGTLFMGLELARELDQMAAKQGPKPRPEA
jgi:hypothetical protein